MTLDPTHLQGRLDLLDRRRRLIGGSVWAVAGLMILFSLGTGTQLLVDHDVPWLIAWMPSLAADVALCAALTGDQVLSEEDEGEVWGKVLRYVCAAVALGLNIGGSLAHDGGPDWGGVGIHAAPILVLIVATEAAQAYQRAFARIARRIRAELDRQRTAHRAADDAERARAEAERLAVQAAERAAAGRVRAEAEAAARQNRAEPQTRRPAKPTASAPATVEACVSAALTHRQTHGDLPGPAELMRFTGASRSTADRALSRARGPRELQPAAAG